MSPLTPPRAPLFSKSEHAYAQVRARIFSGELAPGDVIGQARLAAEIGVSTTPLREALKRLSSEGIVILGVHQDARVVTLTDGDGRDLYEARMAVDPIACALAADRRTTEDIAQLREALDGLEPLAGTSQPDALAAHRRFHRSIYRASKNPVLVDILDRLWDRSDLYRLQALRAEVPPATERARIHDQHRELVEAIARGDAPGASRIAEQHIANSLGRRALDPVRPRL